MYRRGAEKSREMMLEELLGYDRITIQCHGLKKVAEALYHQKIFSTLASVEGSPHGVVAALVEGKRLVIIRQTEGSADGVERHPVAAVEIEQRVIGIKQ